MAHYAFVNDENIVVEIIPGRNENEVIDGISDWEEYYSAKRENLRAIRTSYNTYSGVLYDRETGDPSEDQSKAFRGNYAGIGFEYREDLDAFIPPQPEPSDEVSEWVLDEETFSWVPVGE